MKKQFCPKGHDTFVTGRYKDSSCADHCHQTERQRGILCPQCNSGLGHFKDNIEALSAAIEYLKGHNGY